MLGRVRCGLKKGNYKVSMMLNYSTAQEKKFYNDFSPVGFPI